jgi:hypothetical protein
MINDTWIMCPQGHELDDTFSFFENDETIDNITCAVFEYVHCERPPNYPMPTMIGEVRYYTDRHWYEITITDCDETFDPRLCIEVLKHQNNEVITDYPHDSPNYR